MKIHPLIISFKENQDNGKTISVIFNEDLLLWFTEHGATEDEAHTLVWETTVVHGISLFTVGGFASMVRKHLPSMIANDMIGVQPMTGPTGLVYSMRSRYSSTP